MANTIKITILEDGTIKCETDDMSGPLHQTADAFLAQIQRDAGGEVSIESIKEHSHHGVGQHSHEHGEHHHHH